ncbi:MAG: phosphonopyruvate decarboxylase [Bacteroidetes bacterium HGW-Bacteroidetes-4]|jgi:phosphonopyruvate decarboxylase|nr:MAG: phosphonopyruvate decarboxylase [Bacteroidetes bacterium HGW-Bacteroidetes-4]
MIRPENFYKWLIGNQVDFFCGVPDSLLKDICAYITDNAPANKHVITANEGNAIALAAGYQMATGNIPLVYMQNSGIGNAVNPLLSLTDKQVYCIPILLMIGWRGEPGINDEPQHVTQGEVMLDLLKAMHIPFLILSEDENEASLQVNNALSEIKSTNHPFAFVVRKGVFNAYKIKNIQKIPYELSREDAIKHVVNKLDGSEVIVSTTGKTSRELFECREELNHPHFSDFLTVGCMGHANQIALGIALTKPDKKVICIDGDGALIMHMGSLAINGKMAPNNYIHIVINNGAHESVGGQPTVGFDLDITALALACNYKTALSVSTSNELDNALDSIHAESCPTLIEVKVRMGSRDNLGRPTIKPIDNKKDFMKNLKS